MKRTVTVRCRAIEIEGDIAEMFVMSEQLRELGRAKLEEDLRQMSERITREIMALYGKDSDDAP